MMARRFLLLSTSKVYGSGYLEYCDAEIRSFLEEVERLLFVPFARPSGMSHDDYTAVARERFAKLQIDGAAYREEYIAEVQQYRNQLQQECGQNGIDYVALDTSMPFDKALMEYLLRRRGK